MPILGIIASSFRSAAGPQGAYDALATVTLSAATASVTFAGIPSGYKHLQLRMIARSSGSGGSFVTVKVNGDTTAGNYSRHLLVGDGANANAYANVGTATNLGKIADSSNSANIFGSFILDILDYASVVKYKTFRSIGGFDGNGSGEFDLNSILWMNTSSPISSITFTEVYGSNYTANTQFALYGVK
jgi:hypothetical protein